MATTNDTFMAMIAAGTFLMLPTLLAVPVTQFVMRRLARVVPIAAEESKRAMGIDAYAAERLAKGIIAAAAFAPGAAEGIIQLEYEPVKALDAEGFMARNQRLTRAAMTAHLLTRMLVWVSRPFGSARLGAFLAALRTIATHTDAEGLVDSMDTYERFIKAHPPEPEPIRVLA